MTKKTQEIMSKRLVDIRKELTVHPTRKWATRKLTEVKYLGIHHSGGSETGNAFSFARDHVNNRGWAGIGYHYVILRDGTIQGCGDWTTVRANVANNNRPTIGISLVGDFTKISPSYAQQESAFALCEYLMERIPSIEKILGHNEFPGQTTDCPGLDMNIFRSNFKKYIGEESEFYYDVKDLQTLMNQLDSKLEIDGSEGPLTKTEIKKYQKLFNLKEDGIVTKELLDRMAQEVNAKKFTTLKLRSKGEEVKKLQQLLNKCNYLIGVDGSFGNITRRAVMAFQDFFGLKVTGEVDKSTYSALESYSSKEKSLWKYTDYFNSQVWILELPQDKFFVDFDFGVQNKLETVKKIVEDKLKVNPKIVAGINCGFFGGTNEHIGLVIDEGKFIKTAHQDFIDLLYYKNGKMEIVDWNVNTPGVANYKDKLHWGMGTSYSLVINGVINLRKTDKFSHSISTNPRTLIGQKENGDIVIVVIDGRSSISRGLSAKESAQLMLSLGCINAVNLDGGGSTTAVEVLNGKATVINNPSDKNERAIGSALLIYRK